MSANIDVNRNMEDARVQYEIGRKRKSASIDTLLSDINICDSGRETPENIAAAPETFQRHFQKLKRRALGRTRVNSVGSNLSESARSDSTGSSGSSAQFEHELFEQLKGTRSQVLDAMNNLKKKLLLALATQSESEHIVAARERPLSVTLPQMPDGMQTPKETTPRDDRGDQSSSSSSSGSSTQRPSRLRRRASRTDIFLDYMTEECGDDLLQSTSTMDVLLAASKLSSVAVREARKIAHRRSRCLIALPKRYFELCRALGTEFDVAIDPINRDAAAAMSEEDSSHEGADGEHDEKVGDGGNAAFASASADSKRADSVDSGKSVVTTDLLSVYIVIKKALDMMKQARSAEHER